MQLAFNKQVRIAESGLFVRTFEGGTDAEVSEEFGARILEVFPNDVRVIKKENPVLETKTGGSLVIKKKKETDEEDEE